MEWIVYRSPYLEHQLIEAYFLFFLPWFSSLFSLMTLFTLNAWMPWCSDALMLDVLSTLTLPFITTTQILYNATRRRRHRCRPATQIINFDSPRGGISLITEKGRLTTSRLLVQKAIQSDSGMYTCAPSNANPISVRVHILNGKSMSL